MSYPLPAPVKQELAAQAAKRFGWATARGSSSRGGRQAFREMEGYINKAILRRIRGRYPRGPRFCFQAGNHLSGQTNRDTDYPGNMECGSMLEAEKLGSHHRSQALRAHCGSFLTMNIFMCLPTPPGKHAKNIVCSSITDGLNRLYVSG